MDRTKSSGAMVWNTSPYVLVETEELVVHGQNFMMKEFLRCTLWSLWWLNLGALLVHTPDNCHFSPHRILHLIFFSMDNFMPISFRSCVCEESQVCAGLFLIFLKFSPHVCDNYQECLGLFLGFSFLNLWDVVEILGSLLGKMSVKILK